MKDSIHLQEELRDLMKQQVSLLSSFSKKEEDLRKLVLDKDWTGLQGNLGELNNLGAELAVIEEKRNKVFIEIQKKNNNLRTDSFYFVISKFVEPYQSELLALHRQMKMLVVRISGVTSGISAYVNNKKETMDEVLDELMPYRKGNIYSNSGKAKAAAGAESLLLNEQL